MAIRIQHFVLEDTFLTFAGVIADVFKLTGLGYIVIIFFSIRRDCWKRKCWIPGIDGKMYILNALALMDDAWLYLTHHMAVMPSISF
jgi:hypothetical protein